jgi:hypothetical protein
MYTRYLDENEITRRARKSCEDIDKICTSGDAFTLNGSHKDPVQTLLMRRGSNRDSLITPIVESASIDAEKKAAGAGETFLRLFSDGFMKDIRRLSAGIEADPEWEEILGQIKKCAIPARKRDLSRLFSSSSEPYKRIMTEVFESINIDDKILVKKSAQSKTAISRETGYSFEELGVDPRFLSRGTWIRKDVKCFLIDGYIENVSEIHHILEDLSRSRTPAIIFCIDALPDITETLVKNFLTGSLDVVLVKIPVTEMHVNTIVDIGIILGIEPVTAATGETISVGLRRQISISDKVTVSRGKISIDRPATRKEVNTHIRDLRKRIEDNINLAVIIEPRIRSLSSSTLKIDVGMDDLKSDSNIVERLDRTFRSLPTLIKFGFIEKNDFQQFSSDKMCLLFGKDHVAPAEMAYQALKIFLSTRSAIQSIAAGIESVQH